MIVRICEESGCYTHLSYYNPTSLCWEHRRATRRIADELAGKRVLRDDNWLLNMQKVALVDDVRIETWRPHMMSQTFIEGLERREMSETERGAYEDGTWLLPPDEDGFECDNCGEDLYPDHDCPVIGTRVTTTRRHG